MWQLWLILAGIFLIIEIINVGFLLFWFSIGSLIAMVSSFFIKNIIIQTVIFLISSTLLLFTTRSFVNKVLPKKDYIKTNSYSLEGKIGKVIIDIEPIEGKGQIKVGSEVWSAKSSNNTYIPKDTEIVVEKIDGVKALVKQITKD